MAAPELRLNVSLDLGFFRQQLQKLTVIAQSEFAPKLNVKFNRSTLDRELNNLQRAIKRRTYRVEIGGNIDNFPKQIENIRKQLAALETQNKIEIPVSVKNGVTKKDATSVIAAAYKTIRSSGLENTGGKIRIPVSIRPSITQKDVSAFKKAVKESLSGISVNVKANVQGAGFAGSPQGAAGLMEYMRTQGMVGKTASGMEMRMRNEPGKAGGIQRSALDQLARAIFFMAGIDPAQIRARQVESRRIPSINWQATVARPPIGPSATGRALPPGPERSLLSASTLAGFLPGRPSAANVLELNNILAGAIREYFKSVAREVKLQSGAVGKAPVSTTPLLKQSRLAGLLPARPSQASVLELNNILAGAIREYFKAVANQIKPSTGTRGGQPLLGGARNPLMLPPAGGTTPVGQMRFNAVSTGAYVGQPGFTRAPSMPGANRQSPAGQSTPFASPLGAGYFAVGKGLKGIQSAYGQAKNFLDTKKFPVTGAIADLGNEFGTAIKQVLLYGTAYKALAFLTAVPGQAFDAAKALATYRNQLEAVTKQTNTFDQSFAFVDNLATRFNVPLDSARQGFVKLFASMQPAGFEQGQIENLFTGIAKASAAFGLSADKVDRVNYAFAQMASKGQIMSEELKGQLGDVLPGALSLFAEAAQMSIPEFSKAMEDGAFKGKAMEQVLNNVGILLNTKFGPAAQGASKTLQGAVNQIQNNLQLMYESMTPVVNAFAAAFGPQVNSLIKDITSVFQVLTGTFIQAGEGIGALTPRAQALYSAFKTLEPSLIQAGAAIADLGGRFATLLPAIVQTIAAAITLASSPLGRGALIAAVAIGTLTAALKLLEVTGLKAALKAVYAFIGGLLNIPAATGAARLAVIGLKLAITGLVVGGVLIGLDLLIGKLLGIGDAANDSAKDIRTMAAQLDSLAGAGDIVALATKKQEAENEVIIAERLLQTYQKIDSINKQGGYGYGAISAQEKEFLKQYGEKTLFGGIDVQPSVGIASSERKFAAALERKGLAQRSLQTAGRLKLEQEQQLQSQLQKIDLSGGEETSRTKQQSLESYYSLQDQLAKAQTQADIDRIQALFDHRKSLINSVYDLEEARANSMQKDAIAHQRAISDIFLDRQKKEIDARLEVMKAEGAVAGSTSSAETGGKSLANGIAQYITGDPSSPFYAADHGGGNYHEHLAFVSRQAAEEAYNKLTSAGIQVTEFKGKSRVGRHTPGSAHYKGLAFDVPGAQVPVGREKELTARVQSILGIGGGGGAGAARKVPGSEKRDTLATQSAIIAKQKESVSLTYSEVEAQQALVLQTEKYLAQIFGIAEKELQTSMLQKKTAMLRAGATEQEIEDAMSLEEINLKYIEGVKAANSQIEFNNRLKEKGLISQEQLNERNAYQNFLIQELNKQLPKATAAQIDFNKASAEYAFTGRVKALQEEIKLLLIINNEERRLAELRREYKGDEAKAQEVFNLEKIKKNIEDTRALIGDFVSSTASDYKGFLKAVISGEDAVDALKQFQEGLTDKVLTIFLDFAMAPVEKILKESLEGLFLPDGGPIGGDASKKEAPVDANTTATQENTIALKELSAAFSGAAAGGSQTTGLNAAMQSIGGVAFNSGVAFDGGGASAVDTSLEGWNAALSASISDSLKASTEQVKTQGTTFKESLGKAVGAIGVAAGSIMGIAAGISQIKEGGTANVLGGIGSILLGIGGGISGIMGLFGGKKAANGALWKGGFQAFANGGMVTGPTLGLVGEGKYNEAIVPLPDGRSIPVQMQGESIRDKMGGGSMAAAASPTLSMSFQSTTINGVEYVDRAQLEAAMAETRRMASREGAARGATLALDKLANSPSSRRRVGLR